MGSHPLNLALRFLLEVAALVAIGYWGFSQHTGIWRFIIGLGGPVIAAVMWGTFAVPDDPSRFVGSYRGAQGSLDISVDEGLLVTEIGGERYVLEGLKEDNFLIDHPSYHLYPVRFTRDQDEIIGFVHGPDIYALAPRDFRGARSSAPEGWKELMPLWGRTGKASFQRDTPE